MFKIIEKKQLSENVFFMRVEAPEIARNRKAGQFVIIQVEAEFGERIPLTIADANAEEGWIALAFQPVGASTFKLSQMNVGDSLPTVLGPLGNPSKIEKYDNPVMIVGGGFGVAPCYPIVKAHKAIGNKVIMVIAARTKDLIIMEDEMREAADELIIMTDDGSAGRQGVSTIPVKEACESQCPPAEVIAIGPPIMMKFCAATTKPYNVKTTVSLNTIMIDGTGMCGGCRATVGGKTKFVCVDGPEFDAHEVDWDNMMMRIKSFKEREQENKHQCRMQAEADKRAK